MAKLYDIYIDAGSDWFISLALTNPDGSAFPLTDYTATAGLVQNSSVVVSPTITFDADRTQGKLTLSLTRTATSALTGKGTYNCEITGGTPSVTTRILEGNFSVSLDVTS